MEDIKKCKICGFETKSNNGFGSHIKQNHKMDTKDYYDQYVLNGEKIKCKQCDREASFNNIVKGYREYCGKSCSKKVQPNAVGWAYVHKEGYEPWNKGKPMSEEYKSNWKNSIKETEWGSSTPWNKGKKMSDEHRTNWENSLRDTKFGKSPDEETRKKLRLICIERLKLIGKIFHPIYNRKGCEYFNKLMEETGVKIQHAENGGEFHIKELGYWVDGYDKENNTVYEWDEKYHYINDELKEKDRLRQKAIEEFLDCKFIRIRESY
jgi:hypothetical protein